VLVAWSGGPDSTALLHLLLALRDERRLSLVAAHFDHGLRPESAEVATRCADRAARLGVELRLGRPERPPARTQAALRAARYAFLSRAADAEGATRIATGHQADDQAETVLFRLVRGTGLGGLAGIPVRRGRLVRPLLALRAAELGAWLEGREIPYESDPANLDPRWARVRVRTCLLPALAVAGRDPVPELVRLAERAAACDAALDSAAAGLLRRVELGRTPDGRIRVDRQGVLAAPPELRARLLRILAREAGARLARGGTRAGIEFMSRGVSGTRVDIGAGLRLERSFGELRLLPESVPSSPSPDPPSQPAGLAIVGTRGGGVAEVGGRRVAVRWRPGGTDDGTPTRPERGRVALPVAAEHFPLRLRSWRPGDRLRTAGGTRKLKKLFAEARVAREERGRRLVLADRQGRVLWVEEVATASAAAPESVAGTLVIEFENA
jgi:tRNA(Ile)-lysidine synthase